MKTLKDYINNLISIGKYFFTKKEAMTELELNTTQFRFQAYRLSKRKAIKRIKNDFFMIITPEYYNIGSLPIYWIIDAYMKYLDQSYYIGLLSAASMYGATEQQPMAFQIITNKSTSTINLERNKVEFHVFKYCELANLTNIKVPTGYAKISRREQTILDLIRFYKKCGHLNNVALIIKDLAKDCDPSILQITISNEKNEPVLQRLGYILGLHDYKELAIVIEKELQKRKTEYVLLVPDLKKGLNKKSERWKLILNDSLELE